MATSNTRQAFFGFLPLVGGALAAVIVGGALWYFALDRVPGPRVQAASDMPIPGDQVKPPPVAIDLDSPGPTIVATQEEPPVQIERTEEPQTIVVPPPPAEKGLPELQPAEAIDRKTPDPRPAMEEAKRAPAPERIVREIHPGPRPAEPPNRNVIVVVEPPRTQNRSREVVIYPRNEPTRPAARRDNRNEARRPENRRVDRKPVRHDSRPPEGDTMADWHRRFLTEP